jgi:hypothetical protein
MSAFGPKRTFRGGITRRIAPIKRANVPRHLAARKFPSEFPVAKVSASPALMCPLRAGSEIHVPRQMRRLHTPQAPARPSIRRRTDVGPFFHLHASDELVGTALGAEEGGLAFFNVKPILAESIDDVRFMCNENRVGARRRCGG